jgi:orotidine-5'-phosphate decarboxylase
MKKNPIICAIDNNNINSAKTLISSIKQDLAAIKLGLEFFCAQGTAGVKNIGDLGVDIFLDLKLHDIPNTVAKAISQICKLNCFMTTIHTLGGLDMMKAARKAADESDKKPMLIGVTILTSHTDISEIGIDYPINSQVLRLAELAAKSKLDGIVCSPHEITEIKKNFGKDLKLIVPGIRSSNDDKNDQSRTLSAKEALELGADYLVIGRPITATKNPLISLKNILSSI